MFLVIDGEIWILLVIDGTPSYTVKCYLALSTDSNSCLPNLVSHLGSLLLLYLSPLLFVGFHR